VDRRRRRAAVTAAAIVTLAAAPSAAPVTPPPRLSLVVTPAVVDAQASGPGALPAIAITNRSSVGFRLTIFPALAAQAPEGGLTPLRGPRSDATARRMVRLVAPRLVGPAKTVEVHPFFRSYAGRRSVSIALVILGVPTEQPRRGVTYRLNVLAALFVHRPSVAPKPAITVVRASRVRPLRREFVARIRNRGDAPAFVTSVRFRVLAATGRPVGSVSGTPGFVLPRSARNFRATLFHRLPAGRLRVEAVLRWGTRTTRRSAFFRA
jgi:hypothetical protein